MKLKWTILTGVGVVLVAAVLLYSFGYYQHSQRELNKGLWDACSFDNAAAASYWLAKGAEVNARDYGHRGIPGKTALHMCAHFGEARRTVELLLMIGADANAKDDDGCTPLFFANSASVADLLVEYGADVDKRNHNGDTALQAREKNGWHLPDDLKAVLEGNSPTARQHREFLNKHGEGETQRKP